MDLWIRNISGTIKAGRDDPVLCYCRFVAYGKRLLFESIANCQQYFHLHAWAVVKSEVPTKTVGEATGSQWPKLISSQDGVMVK